MNARPQRVGDRDLLVAIRAGEDWALQWVEEAITPIVRHRVFAFADWEDVRQQCLLKILTVLRRDRPVHNIWGLIHKITVCHVVDHNRRSSRRDRLFAKTADGRPEATTTASVDHPGVAERIADRSEFLYVLQRIERTCRDLFERLFVHENSQREVAAQLEITEGNLRVRLKRCRDKAVALRAEVL